MLINGIALTTVFAPSLLMIKESLLATQPGLDPIVSFTQFNTLPRVPEVSFVPRVLLIALIAVSIPSSKKVKAFVMIDLGFMLRAASVAAVLTAVRTPPATFDAIFAPAFPAAIPALEIPLEAYDATLPIARPVGETANL